MELNKAIELVKEAEEYIKTTGKETLSKRVSLLSINKNVKGMTTMRVQYLLNFLCSKVDSYLEVGLWRGATFLAAIEGNLTRAVGVDDWSEFGGPKEDFFSNIRKFGREKNVTILEGDVFSLSELKNLCPFDLVFYDGNHSYESQSKAVELFAEIIEGCGILLVDDWWKHGKEPTLKKIEKLGLQMHYLTELPKGDFWEGVGVIVLSKEG